MEVVIDSAKQRNQSSVSESDLSASEQHPHDSSTDSHALVRGGIPEEAVDRPGSIHEDDAPPLPPRSSLETYIPSPEATTHSFFGNNVVTLNQEYKLCFQLSIR